MSFAPLARIILRYVSGFLVAKGLLASDLSADPDLVLYLGLGIGAAVEFAYSLARKRGWAK